MRKNFLKIASAATTIALALTIGVCNATAAEDDTKISASSTVDLTEENAKLIVMSNKFTEKYEQVFEETLKREVAEIEDNFEKYEPQIMAGSNPYAAARKRAENAAQDECEKLGLYTELVLTPMENLPFKGWRGSFHVESIEGTTIKFISPERFTCTAGDRIASITGKIGYYNMYKKASVTVTYNNGATSSDTKYGTGTTLPATAPKKTGIITEGTYRLYIYNGTGPESEFYEGAFITLYT